MMLSYKKVFLIDSLGALLSAFLLGIVLVEFEIIFGMPRNAFYILSIAACLLMAYSFLGYLFVVKNESFYLKIIARVNLLYCCLILALMAYYYKKITFFGLIYFLAEITIIIILANLEFKIANGQTENRSE